VSERSTNLRAAINFSSHQKSKSNTPTFIWRTERDTGWAKTPDHF